MRPSGLDALDGRSTLRQIEERFGQKALDFVGSLYQRGFVELKEAVSSRNR